MLAGSLGHPGHFTERPTRTPAATTHQSTQARAFHLDFKTRSRTTTLFTTAALPNDGNHLQLDRLPTFSSSILSP